MWARLGDGDRAHKLLGTQLKPAAVADRIVMGGGGTYPNLFDAHPPFQIDGNFGATAGIAEMLLQSQNVETRGPGEAIRIIDLLPALPAAWPAGEVRGLRARGGLEVDLRWSAGRLAEVAVRSERGGSVRLRYGDRARDIQVAPGGVMRLGPELR
jgi:alpha-L-fucosidase 2